MTAREFRVETTIQELPRRWGVVTYQFTWAGFAKLENESLVVSDVFQQGFYLAANDSLEIVPPDGHAITRVEPDPAASQNESVEWTGVEDFADGRPLLRVSPTDSQRQQIGTSTPRARITGTDDTEDTAAVVPAALSAAGLLVLVVGYLLLRDRQEGPRTETTDTDATSDPPSAASDREEVRQLIVDHGGRMPQGDIDDAFEWSKAKTSRVLSQMADDGTVEKTQIGRQNIVTLVDDEDGHSNPAH
jgi:hypothetical protein